MATPVFLERAALVVSLVSAAIVVSLVLAVSLANQDTVVSPANRDTLVSLASTSMLVGLFTNSIIANMRGEILPAKTIRETLLQIPNMSKFLSKEENTRNINDFYELTQLVDAAVQSANRYKSLDYDKFIEFQNKDNKAALIDLRKELATIRRDLQNLREWENKVIASKDRGQWTPQTKKIELDRIEAARQDILGYEQQVADGIDRRIQNLRKQGGL